MDILETDKLELLKPEPVRKDDDQEDDDDWTPTPEQKKAVRHAFLEFLAGVGVSIVSAQKTGLLAAAQEGARAAGGKLTAAQIDEVIEAAADFNEEHFYGLKDDALETLEQVLRDGYADPQGLKEKLEDLMGSVEARAERYAKGGGNAAWGKALRLAGEANGDTGGVWDCNFGPGSCDDCKALHGQWMTWDEWEGQYQQTDCDGGCNCGFHSAANPQSIDENDLVEAG